MISKINNNRNLRPYCRHDISDEGVVVPVSETLGEESFVGVKVDDYYNDTIKDNNCPKSVDYVVAVDCSCDSYKLYILELKGGKRKNLKAKDIYEKFESTIQDFLEKRFKDIFCYDAYKYKSVELYLVNPFPGGYEKYEDYLKIKSHIKDKDTLELDSQYDKVFRFRGKRCKIKKEFPQAILISK